MVFVGYFVCFGLFDSCQTMFTLLVLLSQLRILTFAFPHLTRSPEESRHAGEEGKPGFPLQENPPGNPTRIIELKPESAVFETKCPRQS